ncbi:MAG TPA: HupE/UreJ family protein [Burkholderiaceae bacterium]|nr:HupE/UreJ family protein [Burkholderiaceae bacterium]
MSRRWLRDLFATLVAVLLIALSAGTAVAHEATMAEMELRETVHGEFLWQWTATNRGIPDDLIPAWPDGCQGDGSMLRCGDAGLRGTFAMQGVGQSYSAALVKVYWLDGQSRVYTLTTAQPTVQLYGTADDRRGMGEIAWAYTVLGVAHILSGIDHLMFVVSLLFLVGFNRRLVATITAFTVAHSLTLASSALGWLTLRSPPVEATIALSIVLVAAEALHRRPTLSRRWPALVAFLFGLVHGLGFAGALQQIGLPQNHLLVALLTFNVGVELGQLLVVALAYLLARTLLRAPMFARARTVALYAIGSVAAWWSIARIATMLA